MIDLKTAVRRGRTRAPLRTCIYGGPGVGKTTFVASAPGVVVVPVEEGANQIGCDRLPQPRTWPDLLDQLDALAHQPHDWTHVAIDSIGVAEELAESHLTTADNVRSIKEAAGGYGAGFDVLANEWRLFLRRLESLGQKGIGVLLVAHSQVKQFADPTLGPYDRFIPQLRERTWQQTHRWCDDVLFARKATGIAKSGKNDRARVVFGEERSLLTVSATGFEAKNRYALPSSMPLDWAAFSAGVDAFYTDAKELRARIIALTKAIGEPAVTDKATSLVTDAGEDVGRLGLIESKLREKLENMKEAS